MRVLSDLMVGSLWDGINSEPIQICCICGWTTNYETELWDEWSHFSQAHNLAFWSEERSPDILLHGSWVQIGRVL